LPEVLNDARPERAFEQLACLGLPGSRWDGVPVEELSTGKGNLLGDMKDMRNIELLIFIRFAGISKWDGLGEGIPEAAMDVARSRTGSEATLTHGSIHFTPLKPRVRLDSLRPVERSPEIVECLKGLRHLGLDPITMVQAAALQHRLSDSRELHGKFETSR